MNQQDGPGESFVDENQGWLMNRINRAREGDAQALGELIAYYRNYLVQVASIDMDSRLKGKVSASDVVQETLVNVNRHIETFRGTSPQEFKVWIRRIIQNEAKNSRRRFVGAKRRDVKREVHLNNSAVQLPPIRDRLNTPCTEALLQEKAAAINSVMKSLPSQYQTVIQLRNWQELSFQEIGDTMQLSAEAARKLWCRALVKLQESAYRDFPDLHSGSIEIES